MDDRLQRLLLEASRGSTEALDEVATLVRRRNIGAPTSPWSQAVEHLHFRRWREAAALAHSAPSAAHALHGFILDALLLWVADPEVTVKRASAPRQDTRWRASNGWRILIRAESRGFAIVGVTAPDDAELLTARPGAPRLSSIPLISRDGRVLLPALTRWFGLRVRDRDLADDLLDLVRLPGDFAEMAGEQLLGRRRRRGEE